MATFPLSLFPSPIRSPLPLSLSLFSSLVSLLISPRLPAFLPLSTLPPSLPVFDSSVSFSYPSPLICRPLSPSFIPPTSSSRNVITYLLPRAPSFVTRVSLPAPLCSYASVFPPSFSPSPPHFVSPPPPLTWKTGVPAVRLRPWVPGRATRNINTCLRPPSKPSWQATVKPVAVWFITEQLAGGSGFPSGQSTRRLKESLKRMSEGN